MYSTCLYCTKDLGANEVLETLPIGRRVAFDARQGRLWVVCRSCEKWNLVPFDTRLETIDACERLFSQTRVRFSTDNIGIARLKEGLELVRIGPAQRPEFAAWRYGDQFGRRRKRSMLQWGLAAAGTAGFFAAHGLLVPIIGGYTGVQMTLTYGHVFYTRRRALLRIPDPNGTGDVGAMTVYDIGVSEVHHRGTDDWALRVRVHGATQGRFVSGFTTRWLELKADQATEVLGRILPRLNHLGGSARRIRDAVDLVDERPNVVRLMAELPGPQGNAWGVPPAEDLRAINRTIRLALEMAAHEDTERVALAGELKLLEREWRQAEELAKIADGLAVTDDVNQRLSR